MELHKLKYFQRAAQLEHITKAAEELCVAQPALTQAIRSLENELGVKLFEKRGRNITLTRYGEYLKKQLDEILPRLDSIPLEMERMAQRSRKTVRLNILAASTFVVDTIVAFREKNRDVLFDFEQNDLRNDCDIVIRTGDPGDTDCARRFVKEEKIFLAVPRNSVYAAGESVELSDVSGEGFVMLSSSRAFGVICNAFCQMAGFAPKLLFESDSPAAIRDIIGTGTGVAFWPEYSWGEADKEKLVLLPVTRPECRRQLIVELYEREIESEYALDFFCELERRMK